SATSFGPAVSGVLGSTEARLWTPPLRELTPETSYGFDVIRFADEVLEEPLDPWQEWAVIHAGELLEDGRPRFRTVLMVVARQNGKTHLLRTLALYWAFVERWPLTLGMSTNLEYAAEAWQAAVDKAQSGAGRADPGERGPVGERSAAASHRRRGPLQDRCQQPAGRPQLVDRPAGDRRAAGAPRLVGVGGRYARHERPALRAGVLHHQ